MLKDTICGFPDMLKSQGGDSLWTSLQSTMYGAFIQFLFIFQSYTIVRDGDKA